jgi:UDP-N-acetylmuramate--alanine ligase
MAEFAKSLSALDEVILLDIYPARELPIAGISSAALLDLITTNKSLVLKTEVVETIKKHKPEVLLTLGAGDIDTLVEPLKISLTEL